MRTKLDQIEARLQSLIEGSMALFGRGDFQRRLAHALVEAVQAHLQTTSEGHTIAPDLYVIFLHPETLAHWTEYPNLLENISRNLGEAAREYEIFFSREPALRLEPDPLLAPDGIRVVAKDLYEASGQTATFNAAPPNQSSAIPRNAFLIVEGNRVIPLNQTVINIGRRSDNHLVLHDQRVSRTHAQIRAVRGQYVLFDLNSTGGTMVNGRRVHQCALKPGDVISLSGVPLIYGEELPDDDAYQIGFTRSMNTPDDQPPEIIK